MLSAPSVMYSSTQRYRPVLAALRELGVDVDQALSAVGFSEKELLDPNTRVPRERVVALTRQLLPLTSRHDIGVLAAQRFVLSDIGLLGYILRHSEHALGALGRFERYARLVADATLCDVQVTEGQVRVALGLSGARALTREGVDFSVGMLVRAVQECAGPTAHPLRVTLPRPRPKELGPYRALFGAGVQFDAPDIELRFDEATLRQPCPHHDAQLLAILEQHAQLLLARWPSPDALLEQLRGLIGAQLAEGEPSLTRLSEQLGMSERTLRRKLTELGTSYRELLDLVRRDRALALIGEGKHSILSIAQRVGFNDATAFTRSFRRWTGVVPSRLQRSITTR
jgi:AraC-like DNA-binding protein